MLSSGAYSQVTVKLSTQRENATVVVEPYAPNIVRVSISLLKQDALAGPGYGITASPAAEGWHEESGASGDVLRSSDLSISIAPQAPSWKPSGTSGRHR